MKFNLILAIVCSIGLLTACGEESNPEETVPVVLEDGIHASDMDLTLKEPPAPSATERLTLSADLEGIRLTWEDLQDVKFEEKYYEEAEQLLLFPTFGDSIKAKEGESWVISGYVIPVTPGDKDNPPLYVLSANPFSACFFCGNAGPESVVELELEDPYVLYGTDEFRSFEGTLRLNDSNIDRLNYILEGAVLR